MPSLSSLPTSAGLRVLLVLTCALAFGPLLSASSPGDGLAAESLYEDEDLGLAGPDPAFSLATSDPRVVCLPDDPSAARVEFVFVTSDADARLPRDEMLRTAAWVDRVFADSADRHSPGSFRAVRWHQHETSPGKCEPDLRKIVAAPEPFEQWAQSDGSWDLFRSEVLAAVGASSADGPRRYLIWADLQHPGYCGHGEMPRDTRPDPGVNDANGAAPRLAVVYDGCRGRVRSTEAHELVHTFGAVLSVAPNSAGDHCTDQYDRMCVDPGAEVVCEGVAWLLDCGGDDYYNPGRELIGRNGIRFWNTADSTFLIDRRPGWWRGLADEPDPFAATDVFADTGDHVFAEEIGQLSTSDVTRGCNPPDNSRFCPDEPVTRGQMAAFLGRAVGLADGNGRFEDTLGHVFEGDIAALAAAGITDGCSPGRFCPDEPVTRGQMAAFLARALGLKPTGALFTDATDHLFTSDISALAGRGITRGCDPPDNRRFCPDQPVTRGQMAAFLVRAGLVG